MYRSRWVFVLAAALAALCAATVWAQESAGNDPGERLVNAQMMRERLQTRASRTSTSAATAAGDTVWLGHSFTDHTGYDGVNPSSITNFWNIYKGVNRPGINDPNNAMWDFDNSTGYSRYVGDSLQGWWPIRRAYSTGGGLTLTDDTRPWWALDHGNQVNLVVPAGPGGKRTKGVVGVWHRDPGRNAGKAVTWSPLSGSNSAWCGLRETGDVSVQDAVTGQPFNANALEFNGETGGGTGTNKNLPGYSDQWDQMLYRDLQPAAATNLSISFLYRTYLSTSIGTAAATRTGWFHGDPLAVTTGNFISSSAAGVSAPADSFQVYVGAPVNDAACIYSDGVTRAVYDAQRRWFSEVLRIFEAGVPYYEIFSRSGVTDTLSAAPTVNVTIPATNVDLIRNAVGNTNHIVRLVFRIKTNRGFSDLDSRANLFTSHSYGAAIVDDVTANSVVIGDFETPENGGLGATDNRSGSNPLNVWKSTGKPPSVYVHPRVLSELTYNDLCGPPDSPARQCNISGTVLSCGNFDDGERMGDSRFTSTREVMHGFISPTIDLVAPASGVNEMGLSRADVNVTDDMYVWYDMYAGQFNLQFTGDLWTFGAQSYPSVQSGGGITAQMNGAKTWGELRMQPGSLFNPEPQCFSDIEGFFQNGLVVTSNVNGLPDSLRLFVGITQACFRFAVSLGCNSADGAYFDNVSIGFVDIPPVTQTSNANTITLGPVSVDIWQFFNDAFPANETSGLPGTTAFDTTAAMLKSGINTAPATGTEARFDIPGDSISVKAANATVGAGDDANYTKVRVDMVFRILPGPGNYKISSGRVFPPQPSMQLLQVPANQAAVVSPGDGSFWGQYITDPGPFSAGGHANHTAWDYLTWNSARCDTSELNIFPVNGITGTGLTTANYMSTYHESDPKFATLGINKFVCFVLDTTKAASSTSALNNVKCDGTIPAYLTTVPARRTGWNGAVITKEFTKIIPDGLLTPGSHVQYFFRKSHAIDSLLAFATCPDTNAVFPQTTEGSNDAHRWQQFGVLPDRWKDTSFGGTGMACMLYVDNNDRRGDERVFVSVMDSIGGTRAFDQGNHNGWHASGSTSTAALGVGAGSDPSIAVYGKNKQPGTTWDMYGVKASESLTTTAASLGNRLANRAGMGFATGKQAMNGPTPEMLRTYYRVVTILSGDLTSGILGPITNRSQNDIALLNDYLVTPGGTAQPRGLLLGGDGFMQSETSAGGIDAIHTSFLQTKLGLTLRSATYQGVSGNVNACADMITTATITPNQDIYGVSNNCAFSNDLLQRNPSIPEATAVVFYENTGVNGPYVAAVQKPANATRNWVALSEGWDIRHLFGRYCDTDAGRLAYYYNMFNDVFGSLCTLTGEARSVLDVPGNQHGRIFVDAMGIRGSVMRTHAATVHLAIANAERVHVRLYDVTGRLVRTLADRSFAAGEYDLAWDGADDAGTQAPRGVYFARVESASKGVVGTGRVVMLR
jgi:hypothetical protein